MANQPPTASSIGERRAIGLSGIASYPAGAAVAGAVDGRLAAAAPFVHLLSVAFPKVGKPLRGEVAFVLDGEGGVVQFSLSGCG